MFVFSIVMLASNTYNPFIFVFKEEIMKKIKPVLWNICFFFIILTPNVAYFLFGKNVDAANYENRNMAVKPVISPENYENFSEEYENYFNDSLPFRNQMIEFHNSIDYYLFQQSSSKKVAIGSDGWLFYCDDEDSNPLEQSLGYWNFTEGQLEKIADNLTSTQRVLESLGIEFVLFIPPNKETIYMEFLPDYYTVQNKVTSVEQLVAYLQEHTSIRVVYPKADLLAAKAKYPDVLFYHKLDTHWNMAGAYIGAVSLANELGVKMPPFHAVNLEKKLSSGGDLANMLNISIKDGNVDYGISGINGLITECKTWDFNTEFLYYTAGADKRNLFVWRDSFSSALAPTLATQFENSKFVHYGSFQQQQLFDFQPDIFVGEVVERKLNRLEDFRVTYISSGVTETKHTKDISVTTAINGKYPKYVSIEKKENASTATEQIQTITELADTLIQVPKEETGVISIYIYKDGLGKEMIEEVNIPY